MRVQLAVAGIVALWLQIAHGITLPNHPFKYDVDGNVIDAHDGKLYHFDDTYYFYGTSYNCGFRWRTSNYTTPFCGFKVYSSKNMLDWVDEGYVFDPTNYQTLCADIAACFRPKVVRNPRTKQYVLWMNSGASLYSYTVFTSMNPTGPFVQVSQPVMPYARGNESWGNGDFGIVVGPDGKVRELPSLRPVFMACSLAYRDMSLSIQLLMSPARTTGFSQT